MASTVVGFVGLSDLSLEIAPALLKSGFRVQAFEAVDSHLIAGFLELGGAKCGNPMEAARDATFIIVETLAKELDEIFHGENGITKGLQKHAVVILQSALSSSHIQKLQTSFADEGKNVSFLDAHFFQGLSEELQGKTIAIASGEQKTIEMAQSIFSAICEKFFSFQGGVGNGSKIQMVNDLLEGIHFIASVEAIFLGVRAGIHPLILYDIISNAAGSSRVFVDVIPKLLHGDHLFISSLHALVKKVGFVMETAKSVTFPLPLLATAYQQLLQGSSSKCGEDASAPKVEIWEQIFGISIRDAVNWSSYDPTILADQLCKTSKAVKKIGFVGLGAMGFGMATHLLNSGFHVLAYDVYKPTLSRFADLGGTIGSSPQEISTDVDILIVMVANEIQAENVFYGSNGSIPVLPSGATIILSSTVSPGFITRLEQRFNDECKDFKLVDAPVSGGVKRAADGTLTIMASGTNEALSSCGAVLSALSEKLYIIQGGCGAASSVKMVNQLLAGIHIASAAEAVAFGARLGLNTRDLFEIIKHTRGFSCLSSPANPVGGATTVSGSPCQRRHLFMPSPTVRISRCTRGCIIQGMAGRQSPDPFPAAPTTLTTL